MLSALPSRFSTGNAGHYVGDFTTQCPALFFLLAAVAKGGISRPAIGQNQVDDGQSGSFMRNSVHLASRPFPKA